MLPPFINISLRFARANKVRPYGFSWYPNCIICRGGVSLLRNRRKSNNREAERLLYGYDLFSACRGGYYPPVLFDVRIKTRAYHKRDTPLFYFLLVAFLFPRYAKGYTANVIYPCFIFFWLLFFFKRKVTQPHLTCLPLR